MPAIAHRVVDAGGDVDSRLRRAALHLIGEIDCGAPHVVGEARPSDQPTADLAGVDSGAQLQRLPRLAVEPVDDPLHLDGEVDRPPDVVDARHVQPATREIAVAQRADPLDAEALGRRVELAHQLVDDGQRLLGLQVGRQLVESDDVGEDHRHVLVVLGDGLLPVTVAGHHLFGHERQQQPVVLLALLVEQVLLDREVAAHVVESDCQIAELVT